MSPIWVYLQIITNTTKDADSMLATGQVFAEQWRNPVDISTVLLIVAIDVIQKAFAQGAGKLYVPVCFSFGCVAYQFQALVNCLGDGRLLPLPDYPCKVINLDSGYMRESKNFVIGRLLRDLEAQTTLKAQEASESTKFALRITVFRARWTYRGKTTFPWTYLHLVGLLATAAQFAIAGIPYWYHGDWSVLFITGVGTLLVQGAGILPQWTAEKLPTRQNCKSVLALTAGNGSREMFVIIGDGKCIDLESLATSQTPRNTRPWEKFDAGFLSKAKPGWPFRSFPWGFIITQVSSSILAIMWLMLLIIISAPKTYPASWCLLAVGGLGMFQNAWLAAKELSPDERNIPLERVDQLVSGKVMDGLMDFHSTYKRGAPLLKEYFPGDLRPAEQQWWNGEYTEYEKARSTNKERGEPRRWYPEKHHFLYPGEGVEGLSMMGTRSEESRGETLGGHILQDRPPVESFEKSAPDMSRRPTSSRIMPSLGNVPEEPVSSAVEMGDAGYRTMEGGDKNVNLMTPLSERRHNSPASSTVTMAAWAT